MEITVELLGLLFIVAVIAAWVDTLAGGGGLIVLPVLLFCGLTPVQALATNKCQGFVGTLTATMTLIVKRKLSVRKLPVLMFYTAIGALTGTWLIQQINTDWLQWFVPVLLLSIAGYFWLVPAVGAEEGVPKMQEKTWARYVVPVIGFYDGFFGPGTGSFFAASQVALRGKKLIEATVVAKPLNFVSNITSLLLFAAGGQVIWLIGVVMMVGQMLGAVLGAHSIYWGGAKLIRPIVIFMCIAMSVRQLWLIV
ncbi:TSUP family transporter [Reinekea marinisedimentorum]|uniref:Probable membrane transporter protein n=1 Tax=Reinekea marinisedimentorum TaxID=230495 RepID=A0A4R3I8Q4_9GAMM|nr:TSUP family transporter [Reinekea marinisedimentorum]TCS42662.1 hypothetical protein BCF53_103330 [Reinekea marinisedimentorum]